MVEAGRGLAKALLVDPDIGHDAFHEVARLVLGQALHEQKRIAGAVGASPFGQRARPGVIGDRHHEQVVVHGGVGQQPAEVFLAKTEIDRGIMQIPASPAHGSGGGRHQLHKPGRTGGVFRRDVECRFLAHQGKQHRPIDGEAADRLPMGHGIEIRIGPHIGLLFGQHAEAKGNRGKLIDLGDRMQARSKIGAGTAQQCLHLLLGQGQFADLEEGKRALALAALRQRPGAGIAHRRCRPVEIRIEAEGTARQLAIESARELRRLAQPGADLRRLAVLQMRARSPVGGSR